MIDNTKKETERFITHALRPAFSNVSSSKLLDLLTVCKICSTTSELCAKRKKVCLRCVCVREGDKNKKSTGIKFFSKTLHNDFNLMHKDMYLTEDFRKTSDLRDMWLHSPYLTVTVMSSSLCFYNNFLQYLKSVVKSIFYAHLILCI